jgi:hypothetical protein
LQEIFMPLASEIFSPDSFSENWTLEKEGGLAKQLCRASRFLQGLRIQLRFGGLSRAPIRLLRLQIVDEVVECDWLARSLDPWDADLSRNVQERHASMQSLRDAIDVRAMLFDLMPQIEMAYLRGYRAAKDHEQELIIEGCAQRIDHAARNVHSLVMRAKTLGFRFDIEGSTLHRIPASGVTICERHLKSSRWAATDFS